MFTCHCDSLQHCHNFKPQGSNGLQEIQAVWNGHFLAEVTLEVSTEFQFNNYFASLQLIVLNSNGSGI